MKATPALPTTWPAIKLPEVLTKPCPCGCGGLIVAYATKPGPKSPKRTPAIFSAVVAFGLS